MGQTVTQSSKGQIVIPAQLRRDLNMNAGDQWTFERDGQALRIIPKRKAGRFAKYRGIGNFGIGPGKKAVLKYIREMRGEW